MTMGKRERTRTFQDPVVRTHNLSTSRKTRKPQQIKRPIDGPPQLQQGRGEVEIWKVRAVAAAAAVGNGDQTRAFRSSLSPLCRMYAIIIQHFCRAGTHKHTLTLHTYTHTHAHPQLRPVVTLSRDVGVESDFGETTQRASTILITLLFAAACCSSSSTYFTFLFPFVSFLIFCAVSSCPSSSFFSSIHRRVKPDGMMMISLISITILFLCFFFFYLNRSLLLRKRLIFFWTCCWSTRNLV